MAQINQNIYSSATYTLTIYHDKNGGDTAPSNSNSSVSSSAASVAVYGSVSATLPTRAGYRFIGYATSPSGQVTVQPGAQLSWSFSRQATFDHGEVVQGPDGNTYFYNYYTTSPQVHITYLYAQWEADASTVSTTDGTLGTAQTIIITASDPSYTHTLRYEFAGSTGTIASGVSSSYAWTPALTMAQLIPAAVSATCTVYCDTYDGPTLLGTTQTTCTLSVPSTAKCTVASVVLAETVAGINAKFGAFVQNKSKLSVTGTFNQGNISPSYGATVAAVSVTINGQTLSANGAVTNLLYTSGTNSYTMTITDTRGRTDSYTGTYNVLAYTAPSASETAERNASDDTQIDISYSWTISDCSNNNDKAITISYGPIGGAQTTVSVSPVTYTGTGTYAITGTDPNDTYNVTVTVTDYFTSANASSAVSATGNRIVHVSATDKTVSLHGTNHSDGQDHEHFPIEFHDTVTINGRVLGKQLWANASGWSSGNITVTGLSNYQVFLVRVDTYATSLLCTLGRTNLTSDPGYFRGMGGYSSSSTGAVHLYLNATRSGNTLTMVDCHSINASGTNSARKVIEIIGLI